MTALIPGLTVVAGWILALLGVTAVGAIPEDTFADGAMRWMLFLPGGILGGLTELVNSKRGQRWLGWLIQPPRKAKP